MLSCLVALCILHVLPPLMLVNARSSGCRVPIHRVFRSQSRRIFAQTPRTDVVVTNKNEFSYLVSISAGGQEFSVILDTGSSDFWLVSSSCTSQDCYGIKTYIENSSSLRMTEYDFNLSYLMGTVTGVVAFETVQLGRFEVASQVFALVNKTSGLKLFNTGASGILGLSFPSIASIPSTQGTTLIENIFAAFDESSRFFAFKLGRGFGLNDGSSFTLGEIDKNITSDLANLFFTPVLKVGSGVYDYWKLPLQSLAIDGSTFSLSPSLVPGATLQIAVLDTGTTLMLGPTRDVEAFWMAVGRQGSTRKNQSSGFWEIRCDRGVSVSFLLGDRGSEHAFPIDPSDINWEEGGSEEGWCVGGIQANDKVHSGDWLLGAAFLRNVYVTHHSANSTHQPMIGLLNMTDPSTSMHKFRMDRGPEQPYVPTQGTNPHNSIRLSPWIIPAYITCVVCGFAFGVLVVLVIRSHLGATPPEPCLPFSDRKR